MTLTRAQALIIATGLALVGIAVARAGTEADTEQVKAVEWRHFAEDRSLRGSLPAPTPSSLASRPAFSRL